MRTQANSRDLESKVERQFMEMNETHDRIRTKFLVQRQPDKSESAVLEDPLQKPEALSKGAAVNVSDWR